MPEFLTWIEASLLGRVMRGTGLWTYPIVNLVHVLGVATLFGSILVLDLRLLGFWRRIPLAPIAGVSTPIASAAFVVAAVSGLGLLSANGTEYVGNPWLLVKFPAIALGFINVLAIRRARVWHALMTRELMPNEQRHLAIVGGVSLASWLTAVAAGRMIAYW